MALLPVGHIPAGQAQGGKRLRGFGFLAGTFGLADLDEGLNHLVDTPYRLEKIGHSYATPCPLG